MLNWDSVDEKDDQDEDFLVTKGEDGEEVKKATPAACPLNPDDMEGCSACQ